MVAKVKVWPSSAETSNCPTRVRAQTFEGLATTAETNVIPAGIVEGMNLAGPTGLRTIPHAVAAEIIAELEVKAMEGIA